MISWKNTVLSVKKYRHLQGCFKCKEIGNELFHLDVSVSESVKKLSNGFRDFVMEEQDVVS